MLLNVQEQEYDAELSWDLWASLGWVFGNVNGTVRSRESVLGRSQWRKTMLGVTPAIPRPHSQNMVTLTGTLNSDIRKSGRAFSSRAVRSEGCSAVIHSTAPQAVLPAQPRERPLQRGDLCFAPGMLSFSRTP